MAPVLHAGRRGAAVRAVGAGEACKSVCTNQEQWVLHWLLARRCPRSVVPLLRVERRPGATDIFMRLETTSLRKLVFYSDHLPRPALAALARAALTAIADLHANLFVHGAVNTDHLVVCEDGSVAFVGLGAAADVAGVDAADGAAAITYVGTVSYIPPEALAGPVAQLAADAADFEHLDRLIADLPRDKYRPTAPADVWGLGVVVVEMLLGQSPLQLIDVFGTPQSEESQCAPLLSLREQLKLITSQPFYDALFRELLAAKLVDASGIDFLRGCLAIDPAMRASAAELLAHPFVRGVSPGPSRAQLLRDTVCKKKKTARRDTAALALIQKVLRSTLAPPLPPPAAPLAAKFEWLVQKVTRRSPAPTEAPSDEQSTPADNAGGWLVPNFET